MCACGEIAGVGGGFVCDVKHMSPRVLRQGGVSREDEGEEEEQVEAVEKRGNTARDAYRHKLKKPS